MNFTEHLNTIIKNYIKSYFKYNAAILIPLNLINIHCQINDNDKISRKTPETFFNSFCTIHSGGIF